MYLLKFEVDMYSEDNTYCGRLHYSPRRVRVHFRPEELLLLVLSLVELLDEEAECGPELLELCEVTVEFNSFASGETDN
jgi:hypothetical protein